METQRRTPVLDMTPEGDFVDGAAPPRPARPFDRALARVGGVAMLVALVAGGLVVAALAILFVSLVLPILIVAGVIGAGSLWWRMRRARRNGQPMPRPSFIVIRR